MKELSPNHVAASRASAAPIGEVLGVEYYVGGIEDAIELVIDRALSGQGGFSCLCGVHGIITAQHQEPLMHAMHDAWMNFPDGAPVAWLLRRLGHGEARRVAGPDLMPEVIKHGQQYGLRHLLFGSTPEVLDGLERQLLQRFPDAHIVGAISPPFRPLSAQEEAAVGEQIRAAGPHIVWVGLGLPKQDEWMWRNKPAYHPAVAMGVGAAFDFLAGTKPRAPGWMQRYGLEWLHRLGHEPRRLARRYLATNSEFVWRSGRLLVGRHIGSAVNALRRHA